MQYLRSVLKYIVTFILTLAILTLFMISSAMVPRNDVQDNMLQSAQYMNNHPAMFMLVDPIPSSKIDHFADCVTLSIAYYLDENHPVESAMWTSFHGAHTNLMNEYFRESVTEDVPANQEYLRYWHGSAAVIRFLHLFMNIRQIYIFHIVLMTGLILILLLLLIRKKYYGEAAAFTLSMILVSIWYVPLCLEYTWTVLCMLIASIIAVALAEHQNSQWFGVFFLITGMVTIFLDFLTTETLTLLVPLLLMLRIQNRQGIESRALWKNSVRCSILWLIGYLGMWMMKWLLASVVLGMNVMPYVREHIDERLNGAVTGYGSTGNLFLDPIVLNLKKLLPYELGIGGAVMVVAFILIFVLYPVVSGKVRMKENVNCSNVLLYFLLGLVPFLRFLVMHNHSIIHSFFTHRALAASVMALCFMVFEIIERNPGQTVHRKAVTDNA